jgi:hypothetical protein
MFHRYLVSFVLIAALAGCKTDNTQSDISTPTLPPQALANSAPSISGSPTALVNADGLYSFTPSVNDANGDKLTFSILNRPVWANFNPSTGELSGKPTAEQAGTYWNIVIAVSDGLANATLKPFNIQVAGPTEDPSIAGTPPATAAVGNEYSFTPMANDPSGEALTFSVQNLPAWATFDDASGRLSGTPEAGDVGTASGIVISVSNGTRSASLPVFSISVNPAGTGSGSATLSWMPPAQNTDGSALTNLAGYHVYYGTNPSALDKSVKITNASVSSYVVSDLAPATWYFSVKAYNSKNVESDFSKKVSKTIM